MEERRGGQDWGEEGTVIKDQSREDRKRARMCAGWWWVRVGVMENLRVGRVSEG